jgi:hypothetical protein
MRPAHRGEWLGWIARRQPSDGVMTLERREDADVVDRELARTIGRVGRQVVQLRDLRRSVIGNQDRLVSGWDRGLFGDLSIRRLAPRLAVGLRHHVDHRAGGVVVGSRCAAVQRHFQEAAQLCPLLVGEPTQVLEALVRRRLAGQLDHLFCLSESSVGQPRDGGHALIEVRALELSFTPATRATSALTTVWNWNLLATRDCELQLDQFTPSTCRTTNFEGQIDQRNACAGRISALAGAPTMQIPTFDVVAVTVDRRGHGGDCAIAPWSGTSVEIGLQTARGGG